MLEARIQQHFFEGADLHYQAAEAMARPIAEAAQTLVGALTAGGKVVAVSLGDGGLLAGYFARVLVGGLERERPPLAAMALAGDLRSVLLQLRALGLPGDVLLLLAQGVDRPSATGAGASQDSDAMRALVEAAHAQELAVVGVVGNSSAEIRQALAETDVLVPAAHPRVTRTTEVQLLVLHCLADAVDLQLMGESES